MPAPRVAPEQARSSSGAARSSSGAARSGSGAVRSSSGVACSQEQLSISSEAARSSSGVSYGAARSSSGVAQESCPKTRSTRILAHAQKCGWRGMVEFECESGNTEWARESGSPRGQSLAFPAARCQLLWHCSGSAQPGGRLIPLPHYPPRNSLAHVDRRLGRQYYLPPPLTHRLVALGGD